MIATSTASEVTKGETSRPGAARLIELLSEGSDALITAASNISQTCAKLPGSSSKVTAASYELHQASETIRSVFRRLVEHDSVSSAFFAPGAPLDTVGSLGTTLQPFRGSRITGGTVPIRALPTEIVLMIIEMLPGASLKMLRLTMRSWELLILPRLFKIISVHADNEHGQDLLSLLNFSARPAAQHATEIKLCYVGEVFKTGYGLNIGKPCHELLRHEYHRRIVSEPSQQVFKWIGESHLSKFPHVRKLSWVLSGPHDNHTRDSNIFAKTLNRFVAFMPEITDLHFEHIAIERFPGCHTPVKRLYLKYCHGSALQIRQTLREYRDGLRELTLDCCLLTSGGSWPALALRLVTDLPRLRMLCIILGTPPTGIPESLDAFVRNNFPAGSICVTHRSSVRGVPRGLCWLRA